MNGFEITVTAFGACALLVLLYFALKTKKPFTTIGIGALLGLASLLAVNLTAKYTGVSISVNEYSIMFCTFLGIPGTILSLMINIMLLV